MAQHFCKCGEVATVIEGFYLVNYRRVRVWTCLEHMTIGRDRTVPLPVPADIQAGLDADAAFYAEMERRDKVVLFQERSVKAMFGGHGKPVPVGRVESWRWTERAVFL